MSGNDTQAKPALARFILTDYLGRDWQNELVFFTVEPRLFGRNDLLLLDENQQPVTFQWSAENGGQIAFLTTVPKFSRVQFALVKGIPMLRRNLTIRKHSKYFEVANSQTGIRVYRGTEALRNGPIAGVRLTSGKWVGDGELQLPGEPLNCEVRVLAEGPVFVELEASYTFPNAGHWRIRFRVIAGEPVVLVNESFRSQPGAQYQLKLGAGFEPDHFLWRNGATMATAALKDVAEGHAFVLEPWLQWWKQKQGHWLALYREDGPDLLAIGLREPACWVEPGKTQWDTRVNLGKTGKVLQFQLRGFERKWLLIALRKSDALQVARDAAPLPQQYLIKYSDVPLNRIKDYVLTWKDHETQHPRLFVNARELEQFRTHFKVDPARLARLRQASPSGSSLDDYIACYLATKEPQLQEHLAKFALKQLQDSVDLYVRQVNFPTQGSDPPRHYNQVTLALNTLDAVLQPGVLAPAERERVRAQLAYLGHTLADPSVHSPERGFSANPNMTTSTRCTLGMLACLIPDHPEAKQWAETAIHEMAMELQMWTGSNGGWLEAPHYMTVSMDAIIPLAIALRQTTFTATNWTLDARLKNAIRWLACISTPRDPRLNGARRMPEIGNTYTGERTCLTGWLARLWKEKDPLFARQMQWMWKEQGSVAKPGIGGLYPGTLGYARLMFDPSIPAEAPDWNSEWFPECGAVLRAHFPGDSETYMYYIQGSLHQHYDYDEGSFILWGKGSPLCEDFGYYGRAPAADHSRIDDGVNEGGKIQEFIVSPEVDYLQGERSDWQRQILLVKDKDCLGPNYFVVRDILTNSRPADWRVWIAADETPALNTSQPIRIQGRFDVDLVAYFAETSGGMLSTEELARKNGASGFKSPVTVQRSLHLKLAPNAEVAAILYPVKREQPTPQFTKLDKSRVMRIESPFGTDYLFFGTEPFDYERSEMSFHGQLGTIQIRSDGAHLSLLGKGQLQYKGRTLINNGSGSKTELIKS
jgi:hypothetical protein